MAVVHCRNTRLRAAQMRWALSLWQALLKLCRRSPFVGLSAVFLAGVVFWGGFNWSLELTNTQSFCISCHVMKAHVYPEYEKSAHHNNRTGVRTSCPDCHVPREWVHKVVRKVGATNELFYWLTGSIDTPEAFKTKQLALARRVWAARCAWPRNFPGAWNSAASPRCHLPT